MFSTLAVSKEIKMQEQTKKQKTTLMQKTFYSLQFVPSIGLPLAMVRQLTGKPSPLNEQNWKAYAYTLFYAYTIAPSFLLIKLGLEELLN